MPRFNLELPADSRFELDAESEHGNVQSDFEVNEHFAARQEAHRLHLRTGLGNIEISDVQRPARVGFWKSFTPVGPPFRPGR
jgi:hypothetical protein